MTASQNIFILAALITTAIVAGGALENFAESVNALQDQTEAISEANTQQKLMAIPEEAIGETVARLLEKMNQMQRTVDDLRASNYDLRASIDDHKATIDKLEASNVVLHTSNNRLEVSNAELTNRLNLERSMAEPTICEGVRKCLYVEAEERETLSKDLWEAASKGNAEEVRRLAALGARLEYSEDIHNDTALHVAAGYGLVEALKALIEVGAPLEARRINAYTALHSAVANNQEECVELLLSAGASVQVRENNGWTPLHIAALHGKASIVQKLIDAGADRGAKNNNGEIPKDLAKDADIIALL